MKKILISAAALLLAAGGSYAQQAQAPRPRGMEFGLINFQTADMMNFSRFDYSLSSSRSSGMTGAFTSLGADIASMSINPAGLAMYRGGEFAITTSLATSTVKSTGSMIAAQGDKSNSKYVLNNLGVTFNVLQSSGPVTSVQLGFGYNRLIDLNSTMWVNMGTDQNSVADIFARQLNTTRLLPSDLERPANPFKNTSISTDYWSSILGYKTSLVDYNGSDYVLYALDQYGPKSHYSRLDSKGSVGEYTMSAALNFSNKLYAGVTLSVLSIDNNQRFSYIEGYSIPTGGDPADYAVRMWHDQHVSYSGSGFGAKIGLVYRPVSALRIGAAFHTPQIVSLNRQYWSDMETTFGDFEVYDDPGYSKTDILEYDYKYTTPPRLLVGASYTFGRVAVVSVDYERVWYNGMRTKNHEGFANDEMREDIKADLKGADNFRAGVEFKPLEQLSLRGGFSYMGSALRHENGKFDIPAAKDSYIATAGIGWRFSGGVSIDLNYMFNRTNYSAYDQYDYYDGANSIDLFSGDIKSHRRLNMVALALGVRF